MSQKGPLHLSGDIDLAEPVLMLAYAGWGDAGDSATHAVRFLLESYQVERLASIDMEEFFDFSVARPHARLHAGGRREIVWPNHEFFAVRMSGGGSDLVLGLGIEPHLRWKTYSSVVLQLVERLGVRRVVMLGAYLDDVIYSQPTQIGVFTADTSLAAELSLVPSTYEGPTGIVGVLSDALTRAGVPALSLWARLPHYVSASPNTRGALALLQMAEPASALRFDLSGLEQSAATFDQTVSELITNDPRLSAYVRELKRRVFSQ